MNTLYVNRVTFMTKGQIVTCRHAVQEELRDTLLSIVYDVWAIPPEQNFCRHQNKE